MAVAKYVLSRLTSLSEALSGDKCAGFFVPACACVVRFCQAFPPLSMEASSLLLTIGRITVSRAAGSCGEELGKFLMHNTRLNSRINCTKGCKTALLKKDLKSTVASYISKFL